MISEGTRRVAQTRQNGSDITLEPDASTEERGLRYDIQAVRQKDHVQIRIENMYQTLEITLALPDNTRFAYLAVTGSHCEITNRCLPGILCGSHRRSAILKGLRQATCQICRLTAGGRIPPEGFP